MPDDRTHNDSSNDHDLLIRLCALLDGDDQGLIYQVNKLIAKVDEILVAFAALKTEHDLCTYDKSICDSHSRQLAINTTKIALMGLSTGTIAGGIVGLLIKYLSG